MAVRVQLNPAGIREAMQGPQVRAGLSARAAPIAARARQLAASQGLTAVGAGIRVEDGTRPRGRPFSAVVSPNSAAVEAEHGATPTTRRRLIQRAADIGS